ncbi:MAG TPA: formylmethanofuran dehydrogenase subunit A [Firmicutes bacterium]|nr:formylmethanofuran dehydrogenase subunit A [Bacillota bacterium]
MLCVKGGSIYDPLNGKAGAVGDIYVSDGKIVPPAPGARVIDATGLVVMPGGVDIHSHIAGPKVNVGRVICPEHSRSEPVARTSVTRSGVGSVIPSTFVTGYRYARMGYTYVTEAAAPPLEARHVHEELSDIPIVDKGALILMGNNHFVLSLIREGDFERLKDYAAFLIKASGGYGIKAVNPGGGANWRKRGNVGSLDDETREYRVTPREIIDALIEVNEALGLPHALHLHCNNLGQPTSGETALETMALAKGRRLHITHMQFSAYKPTKGRPFASSAKALAEYVNRNPNITMDVGQVVFGPAVTMTADAPLQYSLHTLTKERWVNKEIEMETQSGIVPLTYRKRTYVGAIQWIAGLELFLMIENPWQISLTTDHPNGGPFTAYPWVIRLLMDRSYREEVAETVNKRALGSSELPKLTREYTLEEIAIITRAGPARTLGLANKGHLGIGADADIAIYRPNSDFEVMFQAAAYVLKGGEVVVREGEVVSETFGKTYIPALPERRDVTPWLSPVFSKFYSVAFENYAVEKEKYMPCEVV